MYHICLAIKAVESDAADESDAALGLAAQKYDTSGIFQILNITSDIVKRRVHLLYGHTMSSTAP